LLNEFLTDREIWGDPPICQPLTIPLTARSQPFLVQPQYVGATGASGLFADVREHVRERYEFACKLGENLAEGILISAPGGRVGVSPHAPLVTAVTEGAGQAVGKVPGGEE